MNRVRRIGLLAGLGAGATLLLSDAGAATRGRARVAKKPRNDHLLAARVAAEIDHVAPHGRGIQVFASNESVTLSGVALRNELSDVLAAVRRIKGVKALRNDLEVYDTAGNVLALQN